MGYASKNGFCYVDYSVLQCIQRDSVLICSSACSSLKAAAILCKSFFIFFILWFVVDLGARQLKVSLFSVVWPGF